MRQTISANLNDTHERHRQILDALSVETESISAVIVEALYQYYFGRAEPPQALAVVSDNTDVLNAIARLETKIASVEHKIEQVRIPAQIDEPLTEDEEAQVTGFSKEALEVIKTKVARPGMRLEDPPPN
jgi:hypothetical protein